MGIFDRFSSLLKSNINDLISKAEDPEKMLTQILVDMRGQLVKAKQQVASAIADEKRLRDQADAEYKQAQDWERRAMLAIQEIEGEPMFWTIDELRSKLREWEAELEEYGYPQSTVSTYIGRSEIFLRWLSGEWRPTGPRA